MRTIRDVKLEAVSLDTSASLWPVPPPRSWTDAAALLVKLQCALMAIDAGCSPQFVEDMLRQK